jgi:ribosomal protein S27AE
MSAESATSLATCPECGFPLSAIHGDEWWCERCPWSGTESDRLRADGRR